MQTFGLWTASGILTTKAFQSLTRRNVDETLAKLDAEWESWQEELSQRREEDNLRRQAENTPPPEPSLRELHPELYEGDYAHFLAQHTYRYIHSHEVITPHCRVRNGVSNGLPPSDLWKNLTATLRVADEIRHRLGTPLSYITSAYRTPSYNVQCGGASRSYHTKNNALDLVYEAGSMAAHEVALALRKEGFFCGGVGLYAGFIHIDTRGANATWVG